MSAGKQRTPLANFGPFSTGKSMGATWNQRPPGVQLAVAALRNSHGPLALPNSLGLAPDPIRLMVREVSGREADSAESAVGKTTPLRIRDVDYLTR